MIKILLLLLMIVLFVFQSTALKKIEVDSIRQNLLVTGISSGMIAAALAVWAAVTGLTFSTVTLLCGLVFGIVFIVCLACYQFALKTGPMTYTAFFFSASMLIPAATGLIFWKEPLTWAVIVGIILFLAAFYFISVFGGEKGEKGSFRWMILCFFTWLTNGSLSIILKIHSSTLAKQEMASESVQIMLISFAVAAVGAMIVWALMGKGQYRTDMAFTKKNLLQITLMAVGTGGGNILVSYLTGLIPSSYLFPVFQGALMVILTLYSAFALKERISKGGRIGVILGILGIIIINL